MSKRRTAATILASVGVVTVLTTMALVLGIGIPAMLGA